MTANGRLTYFLKSALEKVSKREFKTPSLAMIESLPAVMTTITEIINDKNSEPLDRRQALEIYSLFFGKLLRDETSRRKESVKRTRTNARIVKAPPLSSEDFAAKLTSIGADTADDLFLKLRSANQRFIAKNGRI